MINGVIVIDKPQHMTSFDVVAILRRTLKIKKIGHTGTLDPMATGVLPVCIGDATKLVDFLMDRKKTYACELLLGSATDTQDMWGTVTETVEVPALTTREIFETLNRFVGEIEQIPPMYSALKINGQKLVDLARKGIEVERKSRKITIYSLDRIEIRGHHIAFTATCSKGTYIRTLCDDIGRALGTVAHMTSLRRLATEPFDISQAIPIENITSALVEANLVSIEDAMAYLEPVELEMNDFHLKLFLNGVKMDLLRFLKNKEDDIRLKKMGILESAALPDTSIDDEDAEKGKSNASTYFRIYANSVFYGLGAFEGEELRLVKRFGQG